MLTVGGMGRLALPLRSKVQQPEHQSRGCIAGGELRCGVETEPVLDALRCQRVSVDDAEK
jgi:hypothetical protein